MTLVRLVAPLTSDTCRSGQPNAFATASSAACDARPSTAGAWTATTSCPSP